MLHNIIQPGVSYSVRDIVERGWIRNTFKQADRHYVYRLIATGKLRAQNRSVKPDRPMYFVRGSVLIAYRNGV